MLKEFLEKKSLIEYYEKLIQLRDLTLEYNKTTNLTAIRNPEEFDLKNIIDSLLPVEEFDFDEKTILDVGTGGGFPGLVLAIIFPKSKFYLLDSNNKKIKWIDYAINELNISNVETIYGRVEDIDTQQFDVVVSRAVASLPILLEIVSPKIKLGGKALFYKGVNLEQETPEDWNKISPLGLVKKEIFEKKLDIETNRTFIVFEKEKETKKEYPRMYSQIKKKPIY